MCIPLLPQVDNPTTINKCINTSKWCLCVNVSCVNATSFQPNYRYEMCQHTTIQFVFKCVLCYCQSMCAQLQLTIICTRQHTVCV